LCDIFNRRYAHGATLVTANLPIDEWTSTFGPEQLTNSLLYRLTHYNVLSPEEHVETIGHVLQKTLAS